MTFSEGATVVVEQAGDKDWCVVKEYGYSGLEDTFHVYVGMGTDFASVPRFFVWLLPRYGRYTKAAIVHDLLWREYVPSGRLKIAEADAIFRRMLRELEVAFLRRWLMWAAVRFGALTKPDGRKRWLRDSWQVFPLALVSLPVIGPPAVLIGLSLVAFYLQERVVWAALWVGRWFKRKTGHEVQKELNSPSLFLKTE